MANFITIFRVFLVFIAIYLLYTNDFTAYILALVLTIVAFILDGVDGYVARKFNESSKLGAVLDIMSDRIVENTYWVAYAALGWLGLPFAIIALTRGFVVDSLRSVAMEKGYTAFGSGSMQQSKLGTFVCSSKFSRITYAVAKAVAFVFLIVAHIPGLELQVASTINMIGVISAVVAIQFCVIRGLPVLFESKRFFKED